MSAKDLIDQGTVDPTDAEAVYQLMVASTGFFKQAYDRFPDHNGDQAGDAADLIMDETEHWFSVTFPAADFELIRDEIYEKIHAGLT